MASPEDEDKLEGRKREQAIERLKQQRLEAEAKALAEIILSTPENIEAEQGLLGLLLYEPSSIHRLGVTLTAESFYEPLHGQIFASMIASLDAGFLPDAVVLWEEFRCNGALLEMGGSRYLADLTDKAPAAVNGPAYARAIAAAAARRELIQIGISLAREAAQTQKIDAGELLADAERQLLNARLHDRRDDLSTLGEAATSTLAYVRDRTKAPGVSTGLRPLDKPLGPLAPKDLIILGGATGMGKSAVGVAIAQNIADPALAAAMNGRDPSPFDKPRGVIVVGAEMTFGTREESGQVVRRHISDIGFHMFGPTFPTYAQLKSKEVSAEQDKMLEEVVAYIQTIPLVGIKRSGLTMARIRTICLRQFDVWGRMGIDPALVEIDHLGLIKSSNPRHSRYEAQSEVADDAKDLADQLGVAVLALVQVSRAVSKADDKRPQLGDLKDSGSIENAADMVLLAYRDSYYALREPEIDEARKPAEWDMQQQRRRSKELEIIYGKVRESFGVGSAKLWCEIGHNAVRERAPAEKGVLV